MLDDRHLWRVRVTEEQRLPRLRILHADSSIPLTPAGEESHDTGHQTVGHRDVRRFGCDPADVEAHFKGGG